MTHKPIFNTDADWAENERQKKSIDWLDLDRSTQDYMLSLHKVRYNHATNYKLIDSLFTKFILHYNNNNNNNNHYWVMGIWTRKIANSSKLSLGNWIGGHDPVTPPGSAIGDLTKTSIICHLHW